MSQMKHPPHPLTPHRKTPPNTPVGSQSTLASQTSVRPQHSYSSLPPTPHQFKPPLHEDASSTHSSPGCLVIDFDVQPSPNHSPLKSPASPHHMFDDNDDDDEPDLDDLLMKQCGGKIKTERLVGLDTESKIGAYLASQELSQFTEDEEDDDHRPSWLSLYQPLMMMCLESRSLFLMLEASPPKPR